MIGIQLLFTSNLIFSLSRKIDRYIYLHLGIKATQQGWLGRCFRNLKEKQTSKNDLLQYPEENFKKLLYSNMQKVMTFKFGEQKYYQEIEVLQKQTPEDISKDKLINLSKNWQNLKNSEIHIGYRKEYNLCCMK